jgi:hypothetical protein
MLEEFIAKIDASEFCKNESLQKLKLDIEKSLKLCKP